MFKFSIHQNRGAGAVAYHTSKFFLTSYHFSYFVFEGMLTTLETVFNDPILMQFIRIGRLVHWHSLIYQQNLLRQYQTIERIFSVFF